MTLRIEINTDGDAFCTPGYEDGPDHQVSFEVGRILRKLATKIESCQGFEFPLFDINGNAVGKSLLEFDS